MKTKFVTLTLIAALSTAGATSAFAQEDHSRSQPTANQLAPYGYTSSANAARAINVDSNTRHMNVTRLETVKINVGGKTVTWTFDTLGTAAFPLARIIPGAEGVTIYVAENLAYQGS